MTVKWKLAGEYMGKTEDLAAWVKAGVRSDVFPGWSRVAVVATHAEAVSLERKHGLTRMQVYTVEAWRLIHSRRGAKVQAEVGLDNADQILEQLLGPICFATARIEFPWEANA